VDRRRFLQVTAAAAAAAVVPGARLARAADATGVVVFSGGPIQTMTRRGVVSALAVEGDRIVALGEAAQALLKRGAQRVDLDGRALYPGFVDAHSHWFGDFNLAGTANPAWTDVASGADSLRKAVESGWTTVTEHFASDERLTWMRDLDRQDGLPVRIAGYMPRNFTTSDFGTWYLKHPPDTFLSPRVRVAGVKLFADGGITPYFREPWDACAGHPPGFRGDFWFPPETLGGWMLEAARAGYQLTVHCSGDGATDILLDLLADVDPSGDNPMRHHLNHLILLHDDQIERLRRQHVVANVQLSWFHAAEESKLVCWLDEERVQKIGRWRDLLAAGVRTAGSTDFPHGEPVLGPVLRTLFTATTRIGPNGEPPAPWMAAQTITTYEALRLLTRGSSWALREDHAKGSLRRGLLADLVAFSEDPLAVRPERLLDLDVALTVVGGVAEHVHPAHADLGAALA
jgi:predicted amidohydrolase YtcJ